MVKFISLGNNCHIKMAIRKVGLNIAESLPYDFHATLHCNSIIESLNELYTNQKYETKFDSIYGILDDKLLVKEKSGISFVHFFTTKDLVNIDKSNLTFPISMGHILPSKINEVTNISNSRFSRLLTYLNNSDSEPIVFIRYEQEHRAVICFEELAQTLANFNTKNNISLIYIMHKNVNSQMLCFSETNKVITCYGIKVFLYNKTMDENFYEFENNNFIEILNDVSNYLS